MIAAGYRVNPWLRPGKQEANAPEVKGQEHETAKEGEQARLHFVLRLLLQPDQTGRAVLRGRGDQASVLHGCMCEEAGP